LAAQKNIQEEHTRRTTGNSYE